MIRSEGFTNEDVQISAVPLVEILGGFMLGGYVTRTTETPLDYGIWPRYCSIVRHSEKVHDPKV